MTEDGTVKLDERQTMTLLERPNQVIGLAFSASASRPGSRLAHHGAACAHCTFGDPARSLPPETRPEQVRRASRHVRGVRGHGRATRQTDGVMETCATTATEPTQFDVVVGIVIPVIVGVVSILVAGAALGVAIGANTQSKVANTTAQAALAIAERQNAREERMPRERVMHAAIMAMNDAMHRRWEPGVSSCSGTFQ
jgi:hypothetical protein